jgi:hypothetical protein
MILDPLRRQTDSCAEKGQDVTEPELCDVKPTRTFAILDTRRAEAENWYRALSGAEGVSGPPATNSRLLIT